MTYLSTSGTIEQWSYRLVPHLVAYTCGYTCAHVSTWEMVYTHSCCQCVGSSCARVRANAPVSRGVFLNAVGRGRNHESETGRWGTRWNKCHLRQFHLATPRHQRICWGHLVLDCIRHLQTSCRVRHSLTCPFWWQVKDPQLIIEGVGMITMFGLSSVCLD